MSSTPTNPKPSRPDLLDPRHPGTQPAPCHDDDGVAPMSSIRPIPIRPIPIRLPTSKAHRRLVGQRNAHGARITLGRMAVASAKVWEHRQDGHASRFVVEAVLSDGTDHPVQLAGRLVDLELFAGVLADALAEARRGQGR